MKARDLLMICLSVPIDTEIEVNHKPIVVASLLDKKLNLDSEPLAAQDEDSGCLYNSTD
jgi:hypothetical protein